MKLTGTQKNDQTSLKALKKRDFNTTTYWFTLTHTLNSKDAPLLVSCDTVWLPIHQAVGAVTKVWPQTVKLNTQGTDEQECSTLGNVIGPTDDSSPPKHQVFLASRGAQQHGGAGGPPGDEGATSRDACPCWFPCRSGLRTVIKDSHRGRAAIAKSGGPSHRLPGRWNHPHWWRSPLVCCPQTDCRERINEE